MLPIPPNPADIVAVLAILQPDARASARLTGALGDVHEVVAHHTWDELTQAAGRIEACLVDADHPVRPEAERRIARLRRDHPELAIIVHVDRRRQVGLFDLGGLGVDGLVTSDEGRTGLRSDVEQALSTARGARIERIMRARGYGDPGAEVLAWAVANASDHPGVERMQAALGLPVRGLRTTLLRAGLPSPTRLLLWGRLLAAGVRLANDGQTVEEVAFSLGYATATSLARAMKTHTGYTPTEVAEGGGLDLVLEALLARAEGPPPRSGPRAVRLAGLVALLAVAGCAAVTGGSAGVDRSAIEDVLTSPGIDRMHVGILAVDAESGRTLYAHNANRKFVPASNQKILVTAAALSMLGPDYRYRTEIWATGSRSGPVVHGDVVVVASGDPTLSARYWESGTTALEALADSLRAAGVKRVTGAIVVDVSTWDSTTIAPTREVEDLRYTYGATGGAFTIDEGEVEAVVESGPAVGSPARVSWAPFGTEDYVRADVTTASPDGPTRLRPHYLPESRRLVIAGSVAYRGADTVSFAVRDPVRQASAALVRAIERAGIEIEGGWYVRWDVEEGIGHGCGSGRVEACGAAHRLVAFESPTLTEIVSGILGPSQNWMTEQLMRSLADAYGGRAGWSDGVDVVEAFLFEHVGVDTLSVSARDGSGLSAYNLVTPEALAQVLRHMHHGLFATEFRSAMARPGQDGSTIENRLLDLEGRVFAKTGSISNVNSLSGYLVGESGQEVVFSILTNGSGLPSSYVRSAIDDIVRAIAR